MSAFGGQSRHGLLHRICLLLTQSGHRFLYSDKTGAGAWPSLRAAPSRSSGVARLCSAVRKECRSLVGTDLRPFAVAAGRILIIGSLFIAWWQIAPRQLTVY